MTEDEVRTALIDIAELRATAERCGEDIIEWYDAGYAPPPWTVLALLDAVGAAHNFHRQAIAAILGAARSGTLQSTVTDVLAEQLARFDFGVAVQPEGGEAS